LIAVVEVLYVTIIGVVTDSLLIASDSDDDVAEE